ncbi:hypothetical protein AB7C87_09120 [Natrarchaeobius sp. A-rgal3]|uniref:hypothetical protein n=1 Tax=Natrarchaeobius versutus TaxID=1679078 RepID=UPI00350E9FD9
MLGVFTADTSADRRALVRSVLTGGVLLPVLVALGFAILPDPSPQPWWEHFDIGLWVVFVALFAVVGALLATGWRLDCRIAVLAGCMALLGTAGWPIVAYGEPPDIVFTMGGTALVVGPLLALAVPVEYLVRTADDRRFSGRIEAFALAVGVVHLFAVDRLQAVLEGRPMFPSVSELPGIEPAGGLLLGVVSAGLVLLVAVPIVLTWRVRLVSPLGFVLAVFGWAAVRTWRLSLETLPPAGPGFGLLPTPLTLYVWGSSVLVVVAVLFGGLEYLLRRRLAVVPPPSLRSVIDDAREP